MGIILLQVIILVVVISSIQAKEPELPPCPSNMQYFPQNLPMHCRLPVSVPPFLPQLFPNPQQGKPGSFPVPLPGLPSPVSGMGPIPAPMPVPMPMMPMPQAPAHKLPVIVMPFYSPDTSFKKTNPLPPPRHKKHRRPTKKRRPIHFDSSDDDSSSTDTSDESSEHGWWRKAREGRRSSLWHHSTKRRKQQNRDLLTPVLQYVTKDGYVIFEKQISKGEAKDWLVKKNAEQNKKEQLENKNEDHDSNEEKSVNSFNFMIRGDETVEIKTEKGPQQTIKRKILKRKPVKITKEQE